MASYVYTIKTAEPALYALPSTLSASDTLAILHDHSTLARILYPSTPSLTHTIYESRLNPTETKLTITALEPRSTYTASLTSPPDQNGGGVVLTESMPLGLDMTISYSVTPYEKGSGIHLREGRSVTVPKFLAFLVNFKKEVIPKTRNLLRFLEEFGPDGKDIQSALASLEAGEEDLDRGQDRLGDKDEKGVKAKIQ
ncbi:hypothetical protein BDW74DRAFT_184247 [Aspergillus multicolor]|uniref:uncharacterized protein n=1 Tax=Aspergillus multicolor TaxID=41759 RepID=UPI003CCCE2B9